MHPDDVVLNDLVDEALDARDAAEVERHLAACAQCRALVDDLREIRRVAGSLEERQPPARAWSRIERAIRLEDGARFENRAAASADRGAGAGRSRFGMRTLTWLAAAAVLVLAAWVGVRYGMNRPPAPTASTGQAADAGNSAAADAAAAAAVEAELRAAESHYDKAIKGLEQIASSESNALDPKTAATLQKNLAVIDQAISESRAAVRAQPTSEPARESLMDSFKTKLALLQDTVALINEMRKGNEAGAARVVSGLKQKGS